MSNKPAKLDVGWIKLQAGTLRVCVETATVESWHTSRRRWYTLRPRVTNDTARGDSGYLFVDLSIRIGGKRIRQSALLHRLVKMACCCERLTPAEEVDHLDADKTNCCWWNLEVVTGEENLRRRNERQNASESAEDYDPWADPEDAAA